MDLFQQEFEYRRDEELSGYSGDDVSSLLPSTSEVLDSADDALEQTNNSLDPVPGESFFATPDRVQDVELFVADMMSRPEGAETAEYWRTLYETMVANGWL